jgi:hypothetical protein
MMMKRKLKESVMILPAIKIVMIIFGFSTSKEIGENYEHENTKRHEVLCGV